MMLSRVDFPAPDGPVMANQSPRCNDKSTSTSACTTGSVPYCLPILVSSSTLVVELISLVVIADSLSPDSCIRPPRAGLARAFH